MTIQVLVATMHQTDHSLLEKMNIQSDAIVINQCDEDKIERFSYQGHSVLWMSLQERGVGLSRNTAFMRATADVVLFSDEDVRFVDGYPQIIERGFQKNPRADMLLFDLETIGAKQPVKRIRGARRVRLFNSMRYGVVHFTCRRERFFEAGITFNLLFGGGAKYSCGEDSIFLANAMSRHLKIWTEPSCIGAVYQGESTWFKGYTQKYFYDKGVLMRTAFGLWAFLLTPILVVKNRRQTRECGMCKALSWAMCGVCRK